MATAFLFQEIFAKTGPLSRYLQSVNMDYAKALAMIDSVIASLERMRSAPQDIIDIMERSVQDSSSIQWKTTRVSRRMCRNTEDGEVLETSEESWQRKTFFVALDTIIASMRRRFDKNRSLFETLALFAPGNFTDLVKSGKSAQDLHCNVAEFCDKFQLNSNQCLQELLSFAAVYDRFHTPSSTSHRMDVEDITLTDLLSDETNDDGTTGVDQQTDPADQVLANWSFLDALNLLCNPAYHLYDAFPEVCKIYSIAVAIPISTCSAERSFSALKRIKTRLRSTTTQERLEDLLMMSVERKILPSLSCDSIIDDFARSSSELSKALL